MTRTNWLNFGEDPDPGGGMHSAECSSRYFRYHNLRYGIISGDRKEMIIWNWSFLHENLFELAIKEVIVFIQGLSHSRLGLKFEL